MNVPAGHDSAHADGEDWESGGTGGQWIGFSWQLDTTGRAFSSLTPHHYMTTKLLWKENVSCT